MSRNISISKGFRTLSLSVFTTLLLANLGLVAQVSAVDAQSASLEAPDEAVIGSKVEVKWTGPGEQYEPIVLLKTDVPDDAKPLRAVTIVSKRNPVLLEMPEYPGTYKILYKSKKDGSILARRTISVVDVETELTAPEKVGFGEKISVGYKGPGNSYDWIALYPIGAPDDAKSTSFATVLSGRKSVQIAMPEKAGAYELRYGTRKDKRILARRAIEVEGVESSLEAAEQGTIGSKFEVSWTGPGNNYDFVGLYPKGAPDKSQSITTTAILSKRNPVILKLPETPGDFELRYVTTRSKQILARRPLKITAVDSSLEAEDRATADTPLDVSWVGPGNDYDLIALYPAGAKDDAKPSAKASILSSRNPVPLNLPKEEGEYELRYLTAREGQVLARRPLVIEPAGRLAVVFERTSELLKQGQVAKKGTGAVELILDASGSMLKRQDGRRRIEIARDVLKDLVSEYLEEGQPLAFRAFGHQQANSCKTDLEIALSPLNPAKAADTDTRH